MADAEIKLELQEGHAGADQQDHSLFQCASQTVREVRTTYALIGGAGSSQATLDEIAMNTLAESGAWLDAAAVERHGGPSTPEES